MLLMTLISTAALTVAQPASAPAAAGSAAATLAAPGEVRSELFDGRRWTCGADGVCLARGPGIAQPAPRECRRFVARFGVVTRYERDGVPFTGAQLAACNTAARG